MNIDVKIIKSIIKQFPFKNQQKIWTHLTTVWQTHDRHIGRCSTLLVVKEIQIKITVTYHYIFTGITKIKKTDYDKCWWGHGGTGMLITLLWECKMMLPSVWQTVLAV